MILDWLKTYAIAIAGVMAAAGWASAGIQTLRVAGAKRDFAVERLLRTEDHRQAEESARLTSETYRREEQRRATAHQEAIDHAEQEAARARADLALADAAAGRLRDRVAALVASAREAASHPQAGQPSPPADDTPGMLADVLGRCITRVQHLAELADSRGVAGSTCVAAYEALTP